MKKYFAATALVFVALATLAAPAASQPILESKVALQAVTSHKGLTLATTVLADGTVLESGPEGWREYRAEELPSCGVSHAPGELAPKAQQPQPSPVTAPVLLPVEFYSVEFDSPEWDPDRVELEARHALDIMNARHEASGSMASFEFLGLTAYTGEYGSDLSWTLGKFREWLEAQQGLDIHDRFRQLLVDDDEGAYVGLATVGWLPAGIWPPTSVVSLRLRVEGTVSANGTGTVVTHEIGHSLGLIHPGDGDNDSGPGRLRQGYCDAAGRCDVMLGGGPGTVSPYLGSCEISPFGSPFCKPAVAEPTGYLNQYALASYNERMNGDPPPPTENWVGVRLIGQNPNRVLAAQAAINGTPAASMGFCVQEAQAETLCFSGALAGRPEIYLKVIGPRPNDHWWAQLTRFTPSKVQVWVKEIDYNDATVDPITYYVLGSAIGDTLSGLQDRFLADE